MAKDIETHIYAHADVNELEEAKIEAELNYEHYKVPRRSYQCAAPVTYAAMHVWYADSSLAAHVRAHAETDARRHAATSDFHTTLLLGARALARR